VRSLWPPSRRRGADAPAPERLERLEREPGDPHAPGDSEVSEGLEKVRLPGARWPAGRQVLPASDPLERAQSPLRGRRDGGGLLVPGLERLARWEPCGLQAPLGPGAVPARHLLFQEHLEHLGGVPPLCPRGSKDLGGDRRTCGIFRRRSSGASSSNLGSAPLTGALPGGPCRAAEPADDGRKLGRMGSGRAVPALRPSRSGRTRRTPRSRSAREVPALQTDSSLLRSAGKEPVPGPLLEDPGARTSSLGSAASARSTQSRSFALRSSLAFTRIRRGETASFPTERGSPSGCGVFGTCRPPLEVPAEEAVMVGDGAWDEAAARAAGVRFLGLRNGREDPGFEGSPVVEGLEEAARALRSNLGALGDVGEMGADGRLDEPTPEGAVTRAVSSARSFGRPGARLKSRSARSGCDEGHRSGTKAPRR
jgi:hypothetical protein